MERAARFLYLQALAYAGKVKGRTFGFYPVQGCTFSLARLEPRLCRPHARLDDVSIENSDWSEFIPRYDRPTTLVYLDPPYWGSESDYGTGLFSGNDFEGLADKLRGIRGRFLLSVKDVPELRTAFGWADIEPIRTRYSLGEVRGRRRATHRARRRSRRRRTTGLSDRAASVTEVELTR